MRLTLALITGILLTVNAFAVTLTYEDVPEEMVDEINNVVMVKLIRYEKAVADVYDTKKKQALDAKVEAIRERIMPTPVVEAPKKPSVIENVLDLFKPKVEPSVNWEDTEAIR
jgi:hypothetical protein